MYHWSGDVNNLVTAKMTFPLIWSGRMRAREGVISSLHVAGQLELLLASCGPRSLVRKQTLIDFVSARSRRPGAWNVLGPATGGHLDVRETPYGIEVCFEIFLTQLCFTTASLLMVTSLFAFAMRGAPLLFRLLVLVSLPCLSFCSNFFIFRFRFQRLIEQAFANASERGADTCIRRPQAL